MRRNARWNFELTIQTWSFKRNKCNENRLRYWIWSYYSIRSLSVFLKFTNLEKKNGRKYLLGLVRRLVVDNWLFSDRCGPRSEWCGGSSASKREPVTFRLVIRFEEVLSVLNSSRKFLMKFSMEIYIEGLRQRVFPGFWEQWNECPSKQREDSEDRHWHDWQTDVWQ